MFVAWWKFTKPKKWLYFSVLSTVFIHRACLVVAPIFAARVIVGLSAGDYNAAVWNLSIVLGFLIFRNIVWHVNHSLYTPLVKHPYLRLQSEIADKVINATPESFKSVSKDKFLNVLHTDVLALSDVQDLTCTKIGSLMQVIMTIVAVLFLDVYVAGILIGVCVLNYFVLNVINSRIAKAALEIRTAIDDEYEALSNIYEAKDTIIFDKGKEYLKEQFCATGHGYIKAKHKSLIAKSMLNNWFFVLYNIAVFVITLFLIYNISKGNMTFEMYLILVPYLLLVIEACNQFFDMFKDIKTGVVHMNRIEKLLNLPDKESQKYGDSEIEFGEMGIDFVGVSVNTLAFPEVKNASFCLRRNEITMVHGAKGCGKRTIFYLLTRVIKPQEGKILINGLDVYDYSKSYYQKKLNIVAKKPFLFSGSIIKNLKAFEKSEKVIYEVCEELGIHEQIMSLPNQYHTHASDVSPYLGHMLEFARCILSGAEIILFYETPDTLSKREKENLKTQIDKYGSSKSIVIFSSSLEWADISEKVIKMDKGEVVEIQRNRNIN